MQYETAAKAARRLLALTLIGSCAPMFAGCSDEAPAPPEMTEAEIQKRQADEMEARQKAYGKSGNPSGRNPSKAAAKAEAAAEKATEPAAEKAP